MNIKFVKWILYCAVLAFTLLITVQILVGYSLMNEYKKAQELYRGAGFMDMDYDSVGESAAFPHWYGDWPNTHAELNNNIIGNPLSIQGEKNFLKYRNIDIVKSMPRLGYSLHMQVHVDAIDMEIMEKIKILNRDDIIDEYMRIEFRTNAERYPMDMVLVPVHWMFRFVPIKLIYNGVHDTLSLSF